MNTPEIDALNDGNFELDEDATQGLVQLWAEMVHGEWLWYNDDNLDSDQLPDVAGFNNLVAMVEADGDTETLAAFAYLMRMETAAHAAAHAVEDGMLSVAIDLGAESPTRLVKS